MASTSRRAMISLFMFPHNRSFVLIPLFSLYASHLLIPTLKTPTLPFDLTYMLSPLLLPTLPRPQPFPLISPTCFPLCSLSVIHIHVSLCLPCLCCPCHSALIPLL